MIVKLNAPYVTPRPHKPFIRLSKKKSGESRVQLRKNFYLTKSISKPSPLAMVKVSGEIKRTLKLNNELM